MCLLSSSIQLMPFTPFHLGPALLFGLLTLRFLDFPTFFIASVVLDLEPFAVLVFGLDCPLHGFFHSFIGGTIVALLLAPVMFRLNSPMRKAMGLLKLQQRSSRVSIMAGAILGVYSHILLDAPLYTDIRPFYPLDFNPLLDVDVRIGLSPFAFCILCFLLGAALYGALLFGRSRKPEE